MERQLHTFRVNALIIGFVHIVLNRIFVDFVKLFRYFCRHLIYMEWNMLSFYNMPEPG